MERANRYLETSFLPGRSFTSPADFNTQLADWLASVANTRTVRAIGGRPADRIEADKAAMLALPPVGPSIGWRSSTRLPRDHYVRLDGNDYSVHPVAVGRRIEVTADLGRVRVCCGGNLVADHDRVWSNTRRSPIPTMSRPRSYCAASTSMSSGSRLTCTSNNAGWPTTIRRSVSTGRWRDGRHDDQQRCDCRAGVSDSGLEGPDLA